MVGSNINYSSGADYEGDQAPYILRIEDSEEIMDNKNYKLRDIYFTNKQGFINWTLSITNLKPASQTLGHSHPDNVELCRIERGEAFIVLDGVASRVKAGTYILIDKTVHHKVINTSVSEECIFTSDFPGHLVRSNFVRKKR